MQSLKSMMLRAFLGLAMLAGAGQLFASPVYHVSVDSSGCAAGSRSDPLLNGRAGDMATVQVRHGQQESFTLSDWTAVVPEPATLAEVEIGFVLPMGTGCRRRR